MRLGFWNRLAIVATGLAMLIAPIWYIMAVNKQIDDGREQNYHLCMAGADILKDANKYEDTFQRCWDMRFPKDDTIRPGWPAWREGVVSTLIVCAILYTLIWVIVATIKWIWRGRRAAE